MPAQLWTPDELATLLQMQMEGCSARAIGDRIGRTKNSVIGRLHRMGFCKPAAQKRDRWQADKIATLKTMISAHTSADVIAHTLGVTQSAIRSKLRREKLPPIHMLNAGHKRVVIRRPPNPQEPVSLRLSIFDLKSTTCRWPHGAQGSLHYCGHDAPIDRAYCDYHHELAHCKGTYSERRAADESDKRIAA